MTNTGMARWEFINEKPPAILEHLKILYGTPSLQEPAQALLRLHNPMDYNQQVEVMLRHIRSSKFSSWCIQMEIVNSAM